MCESRSCHFCGTLSGGTHSMLDSIVDSLRVSTEQSLLMVGLQLLQNRF